jgi:hypothetical protein
MSNPPAPADATQAIFSELVLVVLTALDTAARVAGGADPIPNLVRDAAWQQASELTASYVRHCAALEIALIAECRVLGHARERLATVTGPSPNPHTVLASTAFDSVSRRATYAPQLYGREVSPLISDAWAPVGQPGLREAASATHLWMLICMAHNRGRDPSASFDTLASELARPYLVRAAASMHRLHATPERAT